MVNFYIYVLDTDFFLVHYFCKFVIILSYFFEIHFILQSKSNHACILYIFLYSHFKLLCKCWVQSIKILLHYIVSTNYE